MSRVVALLLQPFRQQHADPPGLGQVEADVNDSYHVFISYRVASDKAFAKLLHDELVQRTLEASGQRIRVFLDQVCLKDGERWDQAFMNGLCSS